MAAKLIPDDRSAGQHRIIQVRGKINRLFIDFSCKHCKKQFYYSMMNEKNQSN